MRILISEQDGQPIYLQIVNQVKLMISSGRLRPDEELPSTRVLAAQLIVNPNTVARAYRELEVAGYVVKKRTAGCFVSAAASKVGKPERLELLADKVSSLLSEAAQLGLSVDDLCDFLRSRHSNEVSLS